MWKALARAAARKHSRLQAVCSWGKVARDRLQKSHIRINDVGGVPHAQLSTTFTERFKQIDLYLYIWNSWPPV